MSWFWIIVIFLVLILVWLVEELYHAKRGDDEDEPHDPYNDIKEF